MNPTPDHGGPRICARCVMDTSDGLIAFDRDGVCNHCRAATAAVARRDAAEDARLLAGLVERIRAAGRGGDYDCLLGLSGGIDSSYLALQAAELGLKPLIVHVDTGWNSEIATANIEGIVKRLGYDLITEVIDWEAMRSLQVAFLRAGVANQDTPQDHAIFATLYRLAREYGIRSILNGSNLASESILPTAWGYDALDSRHVAAIHDRFGDGLLDSFPLLPFADVCAIFLRYPAPYPAAMVRLLDHMPYDKAAARAALAARTGFRDYGGKHGESRFTKFFQGFILPRRFGYDKRRAHLSSLIVSGQISRDAALAVLARPAYTEADLAEEKAFVLRKLRLPEAEFEALMAAPARSFMDYPNNHALRQRVAQAAGMVERLRGEIDALIADGSREAGGGTVVRDLERMDRASPLFLYGSGRFGAAVAERLRAAGFANLCGFIDSFRPGSLHGLPVLTLEEYRASRGPGDLILICSQFEDEIAEALRAAGITRFVRGRALFPG